MKQIIHSIEKPFAARIIIPGSKSITNRALLLAALAEGVSELFDILLSDDTRTFIAALRELGILIMLDETEHSCIVGGSGGIFPKKKATVWCEDAATAERFLLAACASTRGSYHFEGSKQLQERPIQELLKLLTNQGMKLLPEDAMSMPFSILGTEGLDGGELVVDSSQTGQYASALLMVAPFAKSPVTIDTQDVVSEPYITMTTSMMSEFGVLVKRLRQGRYYVPVPQRYEFRSYTIEPDLSTASYFFAAAAVTGGELTIQPIKRETSKQGDVAFLTVLEKMGCEVVESPAGLTVKGPAILQGVNVDMRDFSDTFMTLAAIAPFASSPTTITNIRHARLKESDRIQVMHECLESLSVKVESGEDWIKVYPSVPQSGVIHAQRDHRIAMAFSILGLKVGVEIEGAECVSKTCPKFFELLLRQ